MIRDAFDETAADAGGSCKSVRRGIGFDPPGGLQEARKAVWGYCAQGGCTGRAKRQWGPGDKNALQTGLKVKNSAEK